MSTDNPLGIDLADVSEEPLPDVEAINGWLIRCANCKDIAFVEGLAGRDKRDKAVEEHKRFHVEQGERIKAVLLKHNVEQLGGAQCPECFVSVGAPHTDDCDVARCLVNGLQRLLCDEWKRKKPAHSCGADAWLGHFPGEREAQYYGVTVRDLYIYGRWDAENLSWILDELEEDAVKYFVEYNDGRDHGPAGYYKRENRTWVSISSEELAERRKAGQTIYGEEAKV